MKRFAHLTNYRPSDAVWLVLTMVALALIVAAPASAWVNLEAVLYSGIESLD